jgi:hypothetical protein
VESVFGNTWQIAQAVAEGLSTRMPTQTVDVTAAPDKVAADVDLLVVGGRADPPSYATGCGGGHTRIRGGG